MLDSCCQPGCYRKPHFHDMCILHSKENKKECDEETAESFYSELFDEIVSKTAEVLESEHQSEVRPRELYKRLQKKGQIPGKVEVSQVCFPSILPASDSPFFLALEANRFLFSDCVFYCRSIGGKKTGMKFKRCTFRHRWDIFLSELNREYLEYAECSFHDDVYLINDGYRQLELCSEFMFLCGFERKLTIVGCEINHQSFEGTSVSELEIARCLLHSGELLNAGVTKRLKLDNSVITCPMLLSDRELLSVQAVGSVFESEVSLAELRSEYVYLKGCQFEQGFDASRGLYSSMKETEHSFIPPFSIIDSQFAKQVNFSRTVFNWGLEFQNVIFEHPPNFYGINTDKSRTQRETYRVCKQTFDSIGDHLEANRYYALEMEAYRSELRLTTNKHRAAEKIVFYLNQHISDFGQSYVKPMWWIIGFMLLNMIINYSYEENWLYRIYPDMNPYIAAAAHVVNSFAKAFTPIMRFLPEGREFIGLLLYVIYGTLTWQLIVAVKRLTKR